ncbi:Protein disulfide-isomerase [sediment metagenome]|uniref:Protein disulfide-isomerase n=1 Tax=sediment metagenome TaxID=749907 RepID=D9PJB0_9ZZZZ
MAPDVKILEIRPIPLKGLWEIAVESKGQKVITYVDFSKKYLISGALVDIKTKANLTQERFNEINKISKMDVSQIPLDDAIIMGEKDAKLRVIVFTDPDCPYCEKLHQEIKKVIEKRKDIAFVIKMYTLPYHEGADVKAKAIICEKSLALLDDAFAKKQLPAPKCDTKAIEENIKLAEKLGIRGTPTLILPSGNIVPGYKDAESLIGLIDKQNVNSLSHFSQSSFHLTIVFLCAGFSLHK